MTTAQLFRKAIAEPLHKVTKINEQKIIKILGTPKNALKHQFGLPVPKLIANETIDANSLTLCKELAGKFKPNEYIEKVTAVGQFLQFDVEPAKYIQETINQVKREQELYGTKQVEEKDKKTVVIDYSSPNIAKPFHAGHLRSTILGNFIKNIHDASGYKTIGINYLGDWGKQYGLLAIGYELFGNEVELKKDPIHHLYQVYVKINQLSKQDEQIGLKANAYFKRMEQGDETILDQWKLFRQLSINSYKKIYKRLNIEFDYYSGESETETYIHKVYDLLQKNNLIQTTEDGAWIIDLEQYNLGKPIIKRADGTSLYITRDIASLLLRQERFKKIDKAIYVVGKEQDYYLNQLFKIFDLLQQKVEFYHAVFGKVLGMSTRKGTVVFLQDILDTAQEKMLENVIQENQVEDQSQLEQTADQLGCSAVIIQDMLARRVKNYEFSWDRMTLSKGYTGVYLQYTFARLCGIERKSDVALNMNADTSLLKEKEAFELSLIISQFPDVIQSSCQALDPVILVQYLFKLSHSAGQAHSALRVKGTDQAIAEARLLLFWAAKTTLSNGLKLVGINPLSSI